MKVLVIRHGIAMSREEFQNQAPELGRNDDLRPLTEVGVRKMIKNAKGLRRLISKGDLLAASPLTRAQQTAQIVSRVFAHQPIETHEELRPDFDPIQTLKWLSHWAEGFSAPHPKALLTIIGHEPHLSRFIGVCLLAKNKSLHELKKGGACLLNFESSLNPGEGRLEWLLTPKLLREFA